MVILAARYLAGDYPPFSIKPPAKKAQRGKETKKIVSNYNIFKAIQESQRTERKAELPETQRKAEIKRYMYMLFIIALTYD